MMVFFLRAEVFVVFRKVLFEEQNDLDSMVHFPPESEELLKLLPSGSILLCKLYDFVIIHFVKKELHS